MSTPTATPRTDKEWEGYVRDGLHDAGQRFARTLETELAAAQQEAAHYMSVAQKATDELARLRADNLTAHQMACAAGLERDRLRAEVERADVMYQRACEVEHELRAEVERLKKQIKDDNRSYGCELRDPNGTIWEQAAKDHARAERAEAECLEQARLLGKSGEREADLLGKIDRLNRVIERASVQFFHEGTDGETAAKMLNVLNEAK